MQLFNQPKCPECKGLIEHCSESESPSSFVAKMVGAEILMYVIAGLLLVFGMYWYPALAIGLILAAWLFFAKGNNMYICKSCGKQFEFKELYRSKSPNKANSTDGKKRRR